ncbi:universal stress protein [Cognatishimia sp.]|uniref:universal stress protein n=1 Tax=Cognatishimia sp. TaxID=2211648 RepID=UPI0035170997
MYQKILVPLALDHGISPQTLAAAQALCAPGGQITALHVYEIPRGTVSTYLREDAIEFGLDAAKKLLAEKTSGIDGMHAEVIKGHAYRAIIEYADNGQFDCIVIGSHKPGVSDFLMGSTAAKVVRHAACAVHVHRAREA